MMLSMFTCACGETHICDSKIERILCSRCGRWIGRDRNVGIQYEIEKMEAVVFEQEARMEFTIQCLRDGINALKAIVQEQP